ncbi:Glyco_tranf_GTA_type domain containing protein [uncultured Caudovirales phage]|uniref:Glyco_tranf_GTA_type domain containing protein n=1 Tax=uncultured Caudovirales phage TaxID=2100421 RepID=A0A6J5Q062_9CAUD|nr:Glyco_tranf_GTA_type domain containing protein [uncultured Caudovirales phage]CAB4184954.1 Glyco_tranf_GTA_type domain containing protein [uncultured Caudovirales phage]CAB4192897.1 Glyco_tranf_GTA_type domain containing protein [uncultured Caudovirales phage]CAB5231307.1 Glyco_tranf_GTA_type domain containing protein [uncultured Caudovirales phage]
MSIYVSVALGGWDTELATTVCSAFQNRSGNHDIRMGIAFVGTEEGYEQALADVPEINYLNNVTMKLFPIRNYFGIGRGRNAAMSMYSAEDYVLQVDAHTYFANDWDSKLVDAFNRSINVIGHDRVIMTGVPTEYVHPEMGQSEMTIPITKVGYPFWANKSWDVKENVADIGRFVVPNLVPKWGHMDPENKSYSLSKYIKNHSFAPAIKVSGAFMFGNYNLPRHSPLPEDILFWEEEIIQSINFINNGFSLVYPWIESPFYHMMGEWAIPGYGERASPVEICELAGTTLEWWNDKMSQNMESFYLAHAEEVRAYEEYAGIELRTATLRPFKLKDGKSVAYQTQYSGRGAIVIQS